jgi:lactoylglutathione lyase
MRYRHTMIRVSNLEESLNFFCNVLGFVETRRSDATGRDHTNVFVAAPKDVERAKTERSAEIELTYNHAPEVYTGGRNFGHIAFEVDDIYAVCQRVMDAGITINRPPRDGGMAFFKTPDGISIELTQRPPKLEPKEPWASMPNSGTW